MGGLMGWTAGMVREHTLADFNAIFEGFLALHGHDSGPDMSDDAVRELEQLMEQYPDG